jgi:membrane dipeptidase
MAIDFSKNIVFGEFITNLPRMNEGMVGAQFWSVFIDCNRMGRDAVRATMEQIDVVYKLLRQFPSKMGLATSSADIKSVFASKRLASLIGIEGGHSIDASLGALRMFYKLGVRYMTLTHTCNNEIGDSAGNECIDEIDCRVGVCFNGTTCTKNQTIGLTSFGIRTVIEMNRIGMLVDLAHVSANAMRVALTVSKAPVIFSHSSAFALCDNPRNAPNDVLLSLKTNGGVIMVTFVPEFVLCTAGQQPTLSMVADHIDYIITGECPSWNSDCNPDRYPGIGVDHVGIGSDFDGTDTFPIGLENPSKFVYLTAELVNRGYSDMDIGKILGGNLIRVFEAAEQVSSSMANVFPDETMIFPVRGPQAACRTNTIP